MDSFNTALFISSLVLFSTMATKAFSQTQNSPQNFLDAHNNARAQVGVQPLVWNDTVANYALQYANQRSADCNLQHSGGPYGENLAGGSGELSAVDAVGLWVGEKSFYNYDSNSCVGGECLHYTQVVWKDSTRLGCARVQCSSGSIFVICSYDPRGNYIGQRPY
ncbi:hypothetical protein BUALT_Bualt19G0100100 [Buddleja alternifolia]|uniref:SCP domain-containing protein n=1 Tax=Buddleja alternifolia TaxID=168488 RepID=A0AAV6W378_9LAMI|nr:hypothetical protein BUALT_Bualt19G0100100 [Buddleja alternifolia]